MTKKEMEFAVFCIEGIAEHLECNGADVYEKIGKHGGVLDEYIIPNYGVLHSQGKEYIVEDIVAIMQKEDLI